MSGESWCPAEQQAREFREWLNERPPAKPNGGAGLNEPGADAIDKLVRPPLTDAGNGERFAALYGRDWRHVRQAGGWHYWDGRRWVLDQTGRAMQAGKGLARALMAAAACVAAEDLRKAAAAWAIRCESRARIESMLELAATEPGIAAVPGDFDQDPFLLNCLNGVIDLRTGELLEHRRAYMMTKLAPSEYEPGFRHPLWERFLHDATGGDQELASFLQRAAGYSTSGTTREEKLFLVLGPSATGKSTFLEALKAALGDYSYTADFEAFILKRDPGIRNDIAALQGRRLVVSIEVEEGKRLAVALVKSLTGRDTVTARRLYCEPFEFRPACKLWLAANDPPRVRHQDDAIWRRILRVPFEHQIPPERRDPTLKARLIESAECRKAILAWLVEGALRWQEDGLQEPDAVRRATEAYRESEDPIVEFLEDCAALEADATTRASALRRAYEQWAER